MNSLLTRVLSAIVGIAVLVLTPYFFGVPGLIFLAAAVFALGAYEFSQIAFQQEHHRSLRVLFRVFSIGLLLVTIISPPTLISFWGVAVAAFIASSLWALKDKVENERLLTTLAVAVLGFVYCSLLPTFVIRILYLEQGVAWFTLLVIVVFSGDTMAYFGGSLFGKTKLMPNVSPGKTIAGAVAGTIGAALGAACVWYLFLNSFPLPEILLGAILASLLAQNGDLFESLVKRVGNVKDSGRIMPGHGGVLDRLDGIYFAAPLIYSMAQIFLS